MLPLIIFLLLLGLLLLFIEAFIPGGIVGTFGVLIIIVSGVFFVRDYGWGPGLGYFAVSAVVGFTVWLSGFLIIARHLALKPYEPSLTPPQQRSANGRVRTRGQNLASHWRN